MKISAKILFFLSATCVAFVGSAQAQIETFQSQSGYAGSTETFLASASKTEVFNNVLAISSLTYNFFAGSGGGGATTGTTLAATFGEWNGSSIVGTSVNLGQFTIGASNGVEWTNSLSYVNSSDQTIVTGSYLNASHTFDFTAALLDLDPTYGYITNPTKSYALMLTYVSGDTNLALGANTSSSFTNGYQNPFNPSVIPIFNGYDYVFSAISIVPNPTIPESSTVAAILGCVLVAGLVGFRLRQQRQTILAPVAAA